MTPKQPELEHIPTADFNLVNESQLREQEPNQRKTLTIDSCEQAQPVQASIDMQPEIIRIEITSKYDYFMNYVYE